jgi:NADH-quinone oxidoreductase subunit I
MTPAFEYCTNHILKLVAEKEDLLVNHGGKVKEYNFYRHAGVLGAKGTHVQEREPVNVKSNLP